VLLFLIAVVCAVAVVGVVVVSAQPYRAISDAQNTAMGDVAVAKPTPRPAATPTPAPDFHVAQALDPRKLVADPKSYRGTNIELIGKALTVAQHDEYTWVQLMAQTPGDAYTTESVVLEFRPRAVSGDVLDQDCYKVYGTVGESQTVTRALTGASQDVPTVTVYRFESATKNQYGQCSAQW
jgi:hypothetical protein